MSNVLLIHEWREMSCQIRYQVTDSVGRIWRFWRPTAKTIHIYSPNRPEEWRGVEHVVWREFYMFLSTGEFK